ncbi:TIGR03086 family protein [Streptomyces armeniacus]|uniref:TIGR03086 family protein n=1 Tax=Streptomyces armeniacus TaxID=83291 RepID=A0A345XQL3_9ACTN|nr:TIGR03086 family metal-binding protein [Streptomyces armeniacus]AXK33929.1 TIGR03086 family protein [Streptomyces armeniacus]
MSGPEETESTALLERAIGYALCSVRTVTPGLLTRATPCRGWDLHRLLRHTNDSLAALHEGIDAGSVDLAPAEEPYGDPAEAFRTRASRLLGTWSALHAPGPDGDCAGERLVAVGDWPLTAAIVARTGALEIAVHGWDIAQATGLPRPIPPALATELLRTARHLVPEPRYRQPLFALPVEAPPYADPSDRLVAFLGRDPAAPHGRAGGNGSAHGGTGGPGTGPGTGGSGSGSGSGGT